MTVEILILGAGWTSTFLIPLCNENSMSYAATSRSGRDSTIPFEFISDSDDVGPYKALPDAQTILITFPIVKPGGSERLVRLYKESRSQMDYKTAFIQLGTTSAWDGRRKNSSIERKPSESKWHDRHSPVNHDERTEAEEELLALHPDTPTTVLNLSGLWGGQRSLRNWVGRVAATKELLKNKGSIHMIHGLDVSRAIIAVHDNFSKASGQRWMLTDGRVYDWWDLASAWGSKPTSEGALGTAETIQDSHEHGPQARWVRELMKEEGVRALPRNVELLGRALDSREFWMEFGLSPVKARLEG